MPPEKANSTETSAGEPQKSESPAPGQQKPEPAPAVADQSMAFTVRVRMFRHGLGDCHLLTFPRKDQQPFHLLIDFGALNRDAAHMQKFAAEIEQYTRTDSGKSRLDLIVATHEHKDHLSGFNQARDIFDRIEVGGVWMGWTENLEDDEAKELSGALDEAANHLRTALTSPRVAAGPAAEALVNVRNILDFTDGEDTPLPGRKTIAEALNYLRRRGEESGNIEYFEPGTGPLTLKGVDGVRVYVLGPPRQRDLLLGSEVTKEMLEGDVVYHLRRGGHAYLAANRAALSAAPPGPVTSAQSDNYHPFTGEHRIYRDKMWWDSLKDYMALSYDHPGEGWRRIDNQWLGAFDQLALKLANDTNNTSLVLAFEIIKTGEVLLFVGDAQVGNWQSWAKVEFTLPGTETKVPAHDLLRRTVFYKVGHHASHNATLRKGGLELMKSPKLVGFIPLDKDTAAKQGKKDPSTQKPKGWKMPAKGLYAALKERTGDRLVISDVTEPLSPAAAAAGVLMTPTYFEFTV